MIWRSAVTVQSEAEDAVNGSEADDGVGNSDERGAADPFRGKDLDELQDEFEDEGPRQSDR